MKKIIEKTKKLSITLAPPYVDNLESLKDELAEASALLEREMTEVPHAEPGAFQSVKSTIKGHGEQTVLPDDCEFGDNDLCYVES
jgi:hypothetical protein